MNGIIEFFARLLSGVLKITLVVAATVFVMGFLLAALVVVLLASLVSLLTGRKPAPVVMFSRMRASSQRYTQGMWPGRSGPPAGDVVDVEVTEVLDSAAPVSQQGNRPEGRTQPLR